MSTYIATYVSRVTCVAIERSRHIARFSRDMLLGSTDRAVRWTPGPLNINSNPTPRDHVEISYDMDPTGAGLLPCQLMSAAVSCAAAIVSPDGTNVHDVYSYKAEIDS